MELTLPRPIVSAQALIREMETEGLLDYLHELGTVAQDDPHYTGAEIYNQVQAIKSQYRQLTGTDLTADSPGLTIAAAAILHACAAA